MTTCQDLIEQTQDLLLTGQPPQMNKLHVPAVSGATTLEFEYDLNGIKENAYVQVGLEVFYVWSVTPSTKIAKVQPAQRGSTTSAHDQGDLVVVSPKFPDHLILRALNAELNSLSSPTAGLYQTKTLDVTFNSNGGGYDLPGVTSLDDIVDIRAHRGDSSSKDWPLINSWSVDRNVNSTDFPSGLALFLTETGASGSTMRVRYRSGFGQLTNLSDNVTSVTGLPATALDIPPMGATIRLVHPREIKRNFTEAQGDGRRSGEVGSGAVAGSVNALERDYRRRIAEEAARLSQLNPPSGYVPSPGPYTSVRRRAPSNRY